jgi:hypothetical protein
LVSKRIWLCTIGKTATKTDRGQTHRRQKIILERTACRRPKNKRGRAGLPLRPNFKKIFLQKGTNETKNFVPFFFFC